MAATRKRVRFDSRAKKALNAWPKSTTKLWLPSRDEGCWLRAQPVDGSSTGPRLKAAGTDTFKTQPDGLWAFLSVVDPFADCVAIEACSTRQNFADKRSRYQPSTTSTVLHCPKRWLLDGYRWKKVHGLEDSPEQDLNVPVRFLRVLYFLHDNLYNAWREEGVPGGHEYVASYSSIGSYNSQKMQAFLRRMTNSQHFYTR